jgi:hypothetical protein
MLKETVFHSWKQCHEGRVNALLEYLGPIDPNTRAILVSGEGKPLGLFDCQLEEARAYKGEPFDEIVDVSPDSWRPNSRERAVLAIWNMLHHQPIGCGAARSLSTIMPYLAVTTDVYDNTSYAIFDNCMCRATLHIQKDFAGITWGVCPNSETRIIQVAK